MRADNKPHLTWSRAWAAWRCEGEGSVDYGMTPAIAYKNWRQTMVIDLWLRAIR